MANFITGTIGVLLASVFLLLYAVKLASLPLTVIILVVIALMCVDFVQSVRNGGDQTEI